MARFFLDFSCSLPLYSFISPTKKKRRRRRRRGKKQPKQRAALKIKRSLPTLLRSYFRRRGNAVVCWRRPCDLRWCHRDRFQRAQFIRKRSRAHTPGVAFICNTTTAREWRNSLVLTFPDVPIYRREHLSPRSLERAKAIRSRRESVGRPEFVQRLNEGERK